MHYSRRARPLKAASAREAPRPRAKRPIHSLRFRFPQRAQSAPVREEAGASLQGPRRANGNDTNPSDVTLDADVVDPELSIDTEPIGFNGELFLEVAPFEQGSRSPIDQFGLATPQAYRANRLSLRTVDEEELEALNLQSMGACHGRASDLGPGASGPGPGGVFSEVDRAKASMVMFFNKAKRLAIEDARRGQENDAAALSPEFDRLVVSKIEQGWQEAHRQDKSSIDLDFRQQRAIIGEHGSVAIAHLVHDGCDIRALSLSDCGVTHRAVMIIGEGLRQNCTLVSLDLSHNVLGKRGVRNILKYMRKNHTLTTLNLSNTSIDEECAHSLSNRLLLCSNVVEDLDLSHNSLNDRALEGLAHALACNHRMRKLNIEGNGGPSHAIRVQRLHRRISDSSANSSNSNGGAGVGTPNGSEAEIASQGWSAEESTIRIQKYLERNNVAAAVLDDFFATLALPGSGSQGSRNGIPGGVNGAEKKPASRSQVFLRAIGSAASLNSRKKTDTAAEASTIQSSGNGAGGDAQHHHQDNGGGDDDESEEYDYGSFVGVNRARPLMSGSSSVAGDVVGGDTTSTPTQDMSSGGGGGGGHSSHAMATFGKRSSSDDSNKSFGWMRPDQQSDKASMLAAALTGSVSPAPAPFAGEPGQLMFADSSRLNFGFAETRGRRATMEDVTLLRENFGARQSDFLFGIFDGHGGVECAKFAQRWLPEVLQNELAAALDAHEAANRDATVTMCMARAFRGVQAKCRYLNIMNGSCAVIAYVSGSDLYVANLGDSRALLVGPDQSTRQLGRVIKPLDAEELQRIDESGGFVSNTGRVCGMLAVSRALGDIEYSPIVSSEPTFAVHHFDWLPALPAFDAARYAWLVLGCDGVWDVLDASDVALTLKYVSDPARAAHKIRTLAFRRGSADNISVVCVRFDLLSSSAASHGRSATSVATD
ncbi:Protein phosphatase family protein [Hondaea fermentalgiana]|uniref:Protein phosphatase family protein n=1 Tax=Hondaea fermentalgiana TaxID=2315210 RepID=A0A2R5GNM5_9STRA|nr:Protein phosphatase family protein [Hondaea fermentalgiana]|eukprot:GBG32225.1 Protein phosphatase family protein [Hondaea fermentalgiana]